MKTTPQFDSAPLGRRRPADPAADRCLASARPGPQSAFTMIEIAISLGVIGFALVAIIGILPFAMTVPRENREQTIINHDGNVLLDAIRNGAQGLDELTNYVACITNTRTFYSTNGAVLSSQSFGFTYTNASNKLYPITNGFLIVGLLSMPKYQPVAASSLGPAGFYSNHVVAIVRSMTGLASEKAPQINPDVRDTTFTYRLISEVVPYGFAQPAPQGMIFDGAGWDHDWTNYTAYLDAKKFPAFDWQTRSNYWMYAKNLQTDLNEIRLLFRWPALPNGNAGSGRQSFRGIASGPLQPYALPLFPSVTNELINPQPGTLHFAQPRTFSKAQ
jgi:type II secretory pathway pseudopilin PulG